MVGHGASGHNFWELHRQLAECYSADVATSQALKRRKSQPLLPPHFVSRPDSQLSMMMVTKKSSMESSECRSEMEDEKFSSQVLPRRGAHLHPGGATPTVTPRYLRSPVDDGEDMLENRPLSQEVLRRGRVSGQEPSREDLFPDSQTEDVPQNSATAMESLLQLQGLGTMSQALGTELSLKPHSCWEITKKEDVRLQSLHNTTIRSRKILWNANTKGSSTTDVPMGEELFPRHFWLHPIGHFRTCWNSLVALLVLYDILVIPLSVFDIERHGPMAAMDIGMPVFWCLDFVFTFFTGYYVKGALVTDLRKIAWNYALNWMLYDLGLIILDCMFLTLDYFLVSVGEAASWSRSLLMLRILRLARIMRAIKLRQGFAAFQDLLHSQAASLYVSFLTSLGQLLILNHWVACAWFGVRWLHPGDNWVVKSGMDQNHWTYQYLMCVLWSFCQLGVGESPLQPINTTEMLLNCVIAFRALITTATLISTMSDLIAGLRLLREDEATQFRLLRRFLTQNEISPEVGHKVTQFLQHQFAKNQKARSTDLRVPLLDLLSGPLFKELQFARHEKVLCQLPIVRDLLEAPDIQTLEALHSMTGSLCHMVAAARDIIFLSGSRACSAYFMLGGTVAYYRDNGSVLADRKCWVAEACLWTPWIHMGDFEAKEVSDLLCLDADGFCATLSKSLSTQQAATTYAMEFLAAMQKANQLTDIFTDHDLHSEPEEPELPLADVVPRVCCGFCPKSARKPRGSVKLQSVVPETDSIEPDLT